MKRRSFIKSMGALSATMAAPQFFTNNGFIKNANAIASINDANVIFPDIGARPQVINIFMYGGPSELAGNLTNIDEITANSQNPYPEDVITTNDTAGGKITPNGFWGETDGVFDPNPNNHDGAGGSEMEVMLAEGQMSVYRTINRIKDNTRAHRNSIQTSQKGTLDFEMSAGMGTNVAAVLAANQQAFADKYSKSVEELILPFVSFEGETTALSIDGQNALPFLNLKSISLDTNLSNPYERAGNTGSITTRIDELVEKTSPANRTDRYRKVVEQFNNRKNLEDLIGEFGDKIDVTPTIPAGATEDLGVADVNGVPEFATAASGGRVEYPDNGFATRVKAAVTLALNNPDTMFIAVGTGGLGGWDDHDNAIPRYEERMRDLMKTMRAAMLHIQYADQDSGATDKGLITGLSRKTDNIIINIHGDFGRNVNLNGSMGWDHGNNQNLYTFGGAAVRPAGALGKVVGKTKRIGTPGQNRQFTSPTDDSYQVEPMSIAATVYSYFGVQNPTSLTSDAQMNPSGDPEIDETVAGEPTLF
ncbi:MAG: DUF1501 domain-containing protein [Gammaproteobacteria bacterium]|nr:DUF1501 domain-containing protein [Gammaproteobacteria bacterium]